MEGSVYQSTFARVHGLDSLAFRNLIFLKELGVNLRMARESIKFHFSRYVTEISQNINIRLHGYTDQK